MKESKECLGCLPQCKQRPVQWAELNFLQGFELSKDVTMCVSIGLQQNWIKMSVRGVVVFMCFSRIYGGMGHCQLLEGLVPSSLWKPLGPRLARAADTRVRPLSCVKLAELFPIPRSVSYPVCLADGIFDSFVGSERATHTCRLAHWWTPLRVDGLPREVVSSLRMIGPCFLATWRFEDKAIWNDGPRCPQSMSTSISECHFPLRYTEIRSSSLNPLYDTVLVSLFQILRVGHEKLPPSSRCKDSKETRTSTLARVGLDRWLPDAE